MRSQSDDTSSSGLRDILQSRALLAGLLCVFLGAVDLTVIATILPKMVSDIGVNTADIDRYIWVVNSYLIAYVISIPIAGRLSDHIGRKLAFLLCLVIFIAGSVGAALASSLMSVVVARVVQGIGGGGLLPVTIALAGDVLPVRHRLAGIGFVSAVETLGWVVGPTWGASVLAMVPEAQTPWRWVFWLNVPLILVAVVAIGRGFPGREAQHGNTLRDLDLPGTLLLALTLLTSNLALSSGGDAGVSANQGLRAFGGTANPLADFIPWLLGAAGIAAVLLILWERRAPNPILPMALFRKHYFVASVIANFLIGAALMVAMVNVPIIVSLVRSGGDVSRDSALLLAPLTLTIAVVSMLAGRISGAIGTATMTRLGIGLTVVGFGLMYPLVDSDRLWQMGVGLAIAGIGIGMLMAPLSATALDAASPDNRGAATSTAMLFRLLGMTIGMSLLTTAGVYRLQYLTGKLDPIVQQAGESTAEYFVRQQQFVMDVVTPIAVQVMQETFLGAALLAALAIVPVLKMHHAVPED